MELRSLLLVATALPAAVGFQAAARVGSMKPAVAFRAPSTAMLLDPAMLPLDAAAFDAPMQLLALKTEADEVIDTLGAAVFPLGTAFALAVRRHPLPASAQA